MSGSAEHRVSNDNAQCLLVSPACDSPRLSQNPQHVAKRLPRGGPCQWTHNTSPCWTIPEDPKYLLDLDPTTRVDPDPSPLGRPCPVLSTYLRVWDNRLENCIAHQHTLSEFGKRFGLTVNGEIKWQKAHGFPGIDWFVSVLEHTNPRCKS